MLRECLPKCNVNKDNYFRLNVEVGVGEFGMNEWNRLADISTNTRRYLARPEVKKMILDASIKFAKIERTHRRLASHAAAMAREEDDLAPGNSATLVPPAPGPRTSHRTHPSQSEKIFAVELPAEVPIEYIHPTQRPLRTHPSRSELSSPSPDDDALPQHPTPQETHLSAHQPRHSASDIPSYRSSHEQTRMGSISADTFHPPIPPPVPPKTPIPYPEHPSRLTPGAGLSMPTPSPASTHSNGAQDGKIIRPPYPVDESPPVVNRLRKPSYNVR